MITFVSMEALLLSSTLAFLIMRLRRPRPPLRRLIKQPGVVACEVLLLGMFLGICLAPLIEDYPLLSLIVVISGASAIPIAWTILVLRGHWETEPSWIDRLGRGLGVCWAVIIPLQAVFIYSSG
jgi:hypothetical protein